MKDWHRGLIKLNNSFILKEGKFLKIMPIFVASGLKMGWGVAQWTSNPVANSINKLWDCEICYFDFAFLRMSELNLHKLTKQHLNNSLSVKKSSNK